MEYYCSLIRDDAACGRKIGPPGHVGCQQTTPTPKFKAFQVPWRPMNEHANKFNSTISKQFIAPICALGVKPSDNGKYFCYAENELKRIEVEGRVTVLYPPIKVTMVSADKFAWARHTSKIVCEVSG